MSPYLVLFIIFIALPVVVAIYLSFTYFNAIERPKWIGIQNYITLLTRDTLFMQKVLPNTIKYALIVGVGGYVLSFVLAWLVAQLTRVPRTIFALIIYSPSLTAGVTMSVIWRVLFNGDQQGYLNALLLKLGIIDKPVQWLQSPQHLMDIMILVSLWSSMGVGFLAMLAGILNVDEQLYEAAYIDGIKNRLQEIIYVTIPAMKPQMLFGAVMSIVNTFTSAGIGVALSGSNPTPQYAGQLIVNHIEDYGFLRYEMGYAAALSVVLLLIIWFFSRIAWRLFGERY
ncbi:sugar ABC transporter permease [Fervidobacterium islandicum]|uniref:Sugar ABC transporter permease n=1 Tax=Fervidobacterium islandicum TaxID=2423 RepID=A0AAI8CKU4_FERIS|nr:sugar ABC transporter permease [Fervidobacterium islandicum]AMW32282.2 sugar ABC transporter permease [Fervidobacterium islandicum]